MVASTRLLFASGLVFIIAFLCKVGIVGSREVESEFRCKDDSANVIHSRAVGDHDDLHYLLSTVGVPGIHVMRTAPNATFDLNCTKFLSHDPSEMAHSFDVSPQPLYSYTLLFTRLLEYNDTNDTAAMSGSAWQLYDLDSINWSFNTTSEEDLHNNEIKFVAEQDDSTDFKGNGSLHITLSIQGGESRTAMNPHLTLTANTTQIDVALDNLHTQFSQSRFALEMAFVTPHNPPPSHLELPSLKSEMSIDDEHSPGVFEVVNWKMPLDKSLPGRGGYMQWKPVCYMEEDRSYANINRAKNYDLISARSYLEDHKLSLAYAAYGDQLFDGNQYNISGTNVSFGLAKDKFYDNTKYTVWMATLGYGKPPKDAISTMVIIVISIGLGLPVVLIIFGGIGVCIKKYRERHPSPYVNINE